MNPTKVKRSQLLRLTDLPNVGPAIAKNFMCLGINAPAQLAGQDPLQLYQRLCRASGIRHDPCVLDTFISVTRFMDGEEPRVWWAYTAERKQRSGSV